MAPPQSAIAALAAYCKSSLRNRLRHRLPVSLVDGFRPHSHATITTITRTALYTHTCASPLLTALPAAITPRARAVSKARASRSPVCRPRGGGAATGASAHTPPAYRATADNALLQHADVEIICQRAAASLATTPATCRPLCCVCGKVSAASGRMSAGRG